MLDSPLKNISFNRSIHHRMHPGSRYSATKRYKNLAHEKGLLFTVALALSRDPNIQPDGLLIR
jgi:hypothetical protein